MVYFLINKHFSSIFIAYNLILKSILFYYLADKSASFFIKQVLFFIESALLVKIQFSSLIASRIWGNWFTGIKNFLSTRFISDTFLVSSRGIDLKAFTIARFMLHFCFKFTRSSHCNKKVSTEEKFLSTNRAIIKIWYLCA